MKAFALLAFAFVALFLAGCTQPQAQATPSAVPTLAPTASIPTIKPTAAPASTPKPTEVIEEKPTPKPLSFEVTKDEGTRAADGAVPYAFKLSDGRTRLYYCVPEGIVSAISGDGLDFKKEGGFRIASQGGKITCDPTLVKLPDGRARMYYKIASGPGGPGQTVHNVYSAVSSDGLEFKGEGLRIDAEKTGDEGWASVPDAIKLSDGRVRIYYVSGDPQAQGGIGSAVSPDGLVFTKEEGARAPEMVDPNIVELPGGRFLLVVAVIGLGGHSPKVPLGIYYLVSEDGLRFGPPQPFIQESGVYDPSAIWLDDKTIRVFYGKDVSSNPAQPNMVTKSFTAKLAG